MKTMRFSLAAAVLLLSYLSAAGDYQLSNGSLTVTVSSVSGDIVSMEPQPAAGNILGGRAAQVYISDENASEALNTMRTACAPTEVSIEQPNADSLIVTRQTSRGTIISELQMTVYGLEWSVNAERNSGALAGISLVFGLPVTQAANYCFAPYESASVFSNSISDAFYWLPGDNAVKNLAVPVVGCFNKSSGNWGVAVYPVMNQAILPTAFNFIPNDIYGSLAVAATHRRIDPANSIRASAKIIISGTQGDWRPLLGAVYNAFPEVFSSHVSAAADYDSIYQQSFTVFNDTTHDYLANERDTKLSTLQHGIYKYGDYTPPSEPWNSSWMNDVWSIYITDQIDSGHRFGIATVLYFESLLCNQEIADPCAELKACAVKDAFGNYRTVQVGQEPWNTYYMNSQGQNAWTSRMVDEFVSYMQTYPAADGIMCDGYGYPGFIYNGDDGVTVKNGQAVAYGQLGNRWILQTITDYLHTQGKFCVLNGGTAADGEFSDIILAEFDDLVNERLFTRSYAALNKPFIAWPWKLAGATSGSSLTAGEEFEADCKFALMTGAQIAPPYYAYQKWHETDPDGDPQAAADFDFLMERYKPLFQMLRGRQWVFKANAYDPPAGVEGNLFYVPSWRRYVVTVVDRGQSIMSGANPVTSIPLTVTIDEAADVFRVQTFKADSPESEPMDLAWSRMGETISIELPQQSSSVVVLQLTPETCEQAIDLGYQLPSDLDGDCFVHLSEYSLLAQDWQQSIEVMPVTEPNAVDPNGPNEMLFLVNYNDSIDAGFAKGSGTASLVGTKQYLTADGGGLYGASSPNKALENVTDSYYGEANYTHYQTSKNLYRDKGSLIFWAKRTARPVNSSTMTTFFAASNAHIGNTGQKLAVYTAGGTTCMNTYVLFNDGSGNKVLKNLNYYNQMASGDWTFFGVTWDYNEGTGALDVSFYCRDKKYPVNKSVTSTSFAGWNNAAAAPDKMFVGTDFGGAYSGPCVVDQLAVFGKLLTEADFDAYYAAADELDLEDSKPDMSVIPASFLANFNDSLNADHAHGDPCAVLMGTKHFLTADGGGKFVTSSPNRALESTLDSYYGDPNSGSSLKFVRQNNLDPQHGTVTFWAKRSAVPVNASTITTFFSASNAHQGNVGSKLSVYTAGGTSCMNTLVLFNDGSGSNHVLKNKNYFNQMEVGKWTFFGVTWDYDDVANNLDVTFYCRDALYPVNRSITTMTISDWNPSTAGSNYMFVGSDFNGAYAGPCVVDQLAILDYPASESEFDAIYEANMEFQWLPRDCAQAYQLGMGLDADFNLDCAVDFTDLTILASDWLVCNDPENLNCVPNWP